MKTVGVLQREEHSQESVSYPWNPSTSTWQLFKNHVTRKFLRPEATVAYLTEDEENKKQRKQQLKDVVLSTKHINSD